MLRRLLLDGLKTGVALAATTTAAIMVFSKREKGSPWAGLNAVAHVVDGNHRKIPRDFAPRESSIGLAVHAGSMIGWGVLYRAALAIFGGPGFGGRGLGGRGVVPAGIATLVIALVDYELLPPRFAPGIERVLGPLGVGATFAAIGATLALSDAVLSPRALPAHDEGDAESWFV